MQAYDKIIAEVRANRGEMVGISPMTREHTQKLHEELALSYSLLSDAGNAYARKLGLVFSLDNEVREVYASKELDLPSFNGDDAWELPVPALFLIDAAHTVLYKWLETDYTRRPEPAVLMDELLKTRCPGKPERRQ